MVPFGGRIRSFSGGVVFFRFVFSPELLKVADLSPKHLRKLSATDTKLDLNIGETPGFGGLDFLGQIYNPIMAHLR